MSTRTLTRTLILHTGIYCDEIGLSIIHIKCRISIWSITQCERREKKNRNLYGDHNIAQRGFGSLFLASPPPHFSLYFPSRRLVMRIYYLYAWFAFRIRGPGIVALPNITTLYKKLTNAIRKLRKIDYARDNNTRRYFIIGYIYIYI